MNNLDKKWPIVKAIATFLVKKNYMHFYENLKNVTMCLIQVF